MTETSIIASAFSISGAGGGDMFSAVKVIIDVVTPDGRFNVYPTSGRPTIPNDGTKLPSGWSCEVHYRYKNTGPEAEFCLQLQTCSDEPGLPCGALIRTPWDRIPSGQEAVHVHYLNFGAYGAVTKTWLLGRPAGGGTEQTVIPEYDFKIDTRPVGPVTKQFTRIYTWTKDVYLYGSAEDDLEIYWAGTLDSALLEFDIDTFMVGTSFKCHLNDQTIIEGTQYDSAKFSKDIKNILQNGLNHILVEVSLFGEIHWTVNAKITIKYTCTQAEQDQLDTEHPIPKPQCPSGHHWSDLFKMCVPDWFEVAVIATLGIAGLYLLSRRGSGGTIFQIGGSDSSRRRKR